MGKGCRMTSSVASDVMAIVEAKKAEAAAEQRVLRTWSRLNPPKKYRVRSIALMSNSRARADRGHGFQVKARALSAVRSMRQRSNRNQPDYGRRNAFALCRRVERRSRRSESHTALNSVFLAKLGDSIKRMCNRDPICPTCKEVGMHADNCVEGRKAAKHGTSLPTR
jgi:hypothetical protein